jgi:integrase
MRHLSGKTCPLIIGSGGAYVDAVWEVRNMLRVDPVPESAANATPLFRDPQSGDPLRTNKLRDMIRQLMAAAGEPDPSHFGTHSLRIGGATALFAAGADETVIRTMGRWSSDCYRLYVRACFEKTLKWSRLAGSTKVTDVAGEFDEVDFY